MKDLSYLRLFDTYGGLLTDHQRELCELYYMYDLSLTEIAEQKGISKQSVSDTLAKSRALLDEYEQKLHIVQPSARAERVLQMLDEFSAAHPQFSEEIHRIAQVLREGKNDA